MLPAGGFDVVLFAQISSEDGVGEAALAAAAAVDVARGHFEGEQVVGEGVGFELVDEGLEGFTGATVFGGEAVLEPLHEVHCLSWRSDSHDLLLFSGSGLRCGRHMARHDLLRGTPMVSSGESLRYLLV